MVVTVKDGIRLIAVIILCACAVFVCTLFLNYGADLRMVDSQIPEEGPERVLYDAQTATQNVIVSVSGGCLGATAVIVLFFYITRYIDAHGRELGVLKALGWTRFEIARGFGVFGLSAGIGAFLGWAAAWAAMPGFYASMNEDGLLPEPEMQVHGEILLTLVLLPAAAFAAIAIGYAALRLKRPALQLMKGIVPMKESRTRRESGPDLSFLSALRTNSVHSSGALAFFIFMGGFCFACMVQMAPSMWDLSSEWMGIMMFVLGIVLACTCLFLSVTTLIRRGAPSAAIMQAFGYSAPECRKALLSGFRIPAFLGFAVGTAYQYGLLRLMIDIFFSEYPNLPEYTFDTTACIVSLVAFAVLYEVMNVLFFRLSVRVNVRDLTIE